jgi:hypothetical protein
VTIYHVHVITFSNVTIYLYTSSPSQMWQFTSILHHLLQCDNLPLYFITFSNVTITSIPHHLLKCDNLPA